jgi:LEA14-like dessication related protein
MDKAASNMSVELERVEITGLGNNEFDAVLHLRVENRNWYGVDITDLKYEAYVDDVLLGYGRTEDEIELPGEGEIVAKLPLKGSYGRLMDRMYDLLRGRFSYRVKGEIEFEVLFLDKRIPFNSEKSAENPLSMKGGGNE